MQVGVAGVVPAALHVVAPGAGRRGSGSRSGPSPRAGRSCRRAPAWPSSSTTRGAVAGHGHAGGAGPRVRLVGGDEDVQHLGRADAVDDLDAGRLLPERARGGGQRLAGGDALAQRPPSRAPSCRSRAPAAIARYEVGAVKQHGRAGARRSPRAGRAAPAFSSSTVEAPTRIGNSSQPAEAEGEGERRAADEDVVRRRRAARAAGSSRSSPSRRGGSASSPSAGRWCRR